MIYQYMMLGILIASLIVYFKKPEKRGIVLLTAMLLVIVLWFIQRYEQSFNNINNENELECSLGHMADENTPKEDWGVVESLYPFGGRKS